MRITLWISLVTACARGGAPANVDALAPDTNDVSPRCDLAKPFDAPVPVEGLNSASDDSELWFSPDQLTAYFVSSRPGGLGSYDLYFATRPNLASPFSTPMLMPNVNGPSHDGTPLVSEDGLTLYFAAIKEGVARDIYIATRASTAAAFGSPSKLLNVNDANGHETATFINSSGTTLYMSSNKTGDWEMHRATRASSGDPFSAPIPIGELNLNTIEDYGMVLTPDELTVYFESRRSGAGCIDIFTASRSTVNDGFGQAVRVNELSGNHCEWVTWVSADGCEVAFTSDRPGTAGSMDVWLAKRPR